MKTVNSPLLTVIPFMAMLCAAGAASFGTTRVPLNQGALLSGSYQRAYEDRFADNIPLTRLAQGAYNALNLALFQETGPEVIVAERDWLFTGEEFRNPAAPVEFRAELIRYREMLAEHGAVLVPVIIPDKARVYADMLPRARSTVLETRHDRALSVLDELEFPVVDLADVLSAGRETGPTFMRTDTHWSPLGAELAAEALAEAAGLADAGQVQFTTSFSEPRVFTGDLRPFVETGLFRAWVGPTEEYSQQPVTTAEDTGMGLFGDVQIDAVLIGTSFSARRDFNFDGFLQSATGLTVANLAVEGQGPFAPMQDALASGAISDLNPSIVFWEIPERYIQFRSIE